MATMKCICGGDLQQENPRNVIERWGTLMRSVIGVSSKPPWHDNYKLRKALRKQWKRKQRMLVAAVVYSYPLFAARPRFRCRECGRISGFYDAVGRNLISIQPMPSGALPFYLDRLETGPRSKEEPPKPRNVKTLGVDYDLLERRAPAEAESGRGDTPAIGDGNDSEGDWAPATDHLNNTRAGYCDHVVPCALAEQQVTMANTKIKLTAAQKRELLDVKEEGKKAYADLDSNLPVLKLKALGLVQVRLRRFATTSYELTPEGAAVADALEEVDK